MDREIRSYLLVKESEGRAKSTLYEYRLYLESFHAHCGKALCDVENDDIAKWMVQERAKGYADRSLLARQRALRIFFNWCVENEYLPRSPLRMKNPRVKNELPRVASLASVQQLLQHPASSWIDYRNRALVHLLLDTGMRIGEAVSLLVAHVDVTTRLIRIPAGKDKEGRAVPITVNCGATITAYLAERPACAGPWLFVGSRWGKPTARFTVVGARQMLHRFCHAASVDYINPHSIRHLFATKAINEGIRVEIVSRILGHASVDLTLRIYASLLTGTMQKEYDINWTTLDIVSITS